VTQRAPNLSQYQHSGPETAEVGLAAAWADTLLDANVGIGTSSPAAAVHVGVASLGDQKLLQLGEPGFQDTFGLVLRGNSDDGVFKLHGLNSSTETTAPIMSWARNNGRVGIGTASPEKLLHVAGDVKVDGDIAAKYQDIAEWVPAPKGLTPGTVVVVHAGEVNHVLPSSQPYDTRVAGVVSTRPGLLLGEAGEDKAKVAHTGRVKVKVDAQYGPVLAGDLLVTSPTPGHAMRSVPVNVGPVSVHRPGTLVGKALEPLREGQGEILVLLTLQ